MHRNGASLVIVVCVFIVTAAAASRTWVVRMDGAGPVRIGMTLAQLNTALGEKFSMPEDQEEQACFYADTPRHPGIGFMVEHGRVTRIDVTEAAVPTASGIRVGDPEARVMKLYGPKLQVEPHAYDAPEGHYLTLLSADGRYGMRFETYQGRVTGFYAGEAHAIAYIEGCE
jgi:hypothetical protein